MLALGKVIRNTLLVVLGAFIAAVAAPVMAQNEAAPAATKGEQWAKNHPRRAEVNKRLANQHKRIHQKVENGTMSKDTVATLKKEDHQIRQEERDMAAQNGGHITRQEQKTLNQQETAVSQKIGK